MSSIASSDTLSVSTDGCMDDAKLFDVQARLPRVEKGRNDMICANTLSGAAARRVGCPLDTSAHRTKYSADMLTTFCEYTIDFVILRYMQHLLLIYISFTFDCT